MMLTSIRAVDVETLIVMFSTPTISEDKCSIVFVTPPWLVFLAAHVKERDVEAFLEQLE